MKQPEIEHMVRLGDFESWLQLASRSPAEMSLKTPLPHLYGTMGSHDSRGFGSQINALPLNLTCRMPDLQLN